MTLLQTASVAQLGFVAGALAFVSFGVGQPGGVGLLLLALLASVTAWGINMGAAWGRWLGFGMASACAIVGMVGIYGVIAIVGFLGYSGNSPSRLDLAILSVLLLAGITSVVLFVALLRPSRPTANATDAGPWQLAWLAVGSLMGIGGSAVVGLALSTMAERPCCPG